MITPACTVRESGCPSENAGKKRRAVPRLGVTLTGRSLNCVAPPPLSSMSFR